MLHGVLVTLFLFGGNVKFLSYVSVVLVLPFGKNASIKGDVAWLLTTLYDSVGM